MIRLDVTLKPIHPKFDQMVVDRARELLFHMSEEFASLKVSVREVEDGKVKVAAK